jgi:cytochrome c biogenesis protein
MFVPQRDWTREVDYIGRYGLSGYQWLKTLQFDRIYSSWYFLFIMTLLTLNLLACTHKRLTASIRYFKLKQRPIPPQALEKMELHRVLYISGESAQIKPMVIERLKKHYYRVREENGQLFAEKWRWERFGIDVFHVSLLIVLAGGLMTATMTFRTFVVGHKGNEITLDQEKTLKVRVDNFFSKNYKASDRVMDWHSQLTVLEQNAQTLRFEPVVTKVIEVNDPLSYKGYKFFQAAFGQDWMGAAEVTLNVKKRLESGEYVSLGEFKARVDDGVEIPTENIFISVEAFLPDWDVTETGVYYSRTQRLDNPAAFVKIRDKSSQQAIIDNRDCCWAFANAVYKRVTEQQITQNRQWPYLVELIGMTAPEFTGIQVKRDPGQPVAYLGFLVLVLGISVHLFFKHKLIWVQIEANKLVMAGMARNNPRQFEDEFEELVKTIETIRVEPRVPVRAPVNV